MDKAQKRGLIAGLGTLLGSCCVSYTVDQIIKSNVYPGSKVAAIAVKIGGMVISAMVASKADDYISEQFDNAYSMLDAIQAAQTPVE